ncbi:MAG: hypothetical protein AAF547_07765 [Actinomycetota bacterium]
MATDERIMMSNPNTGREAVRIRVAMYEPVRDAILTALAELDAVPFSALRSEVERRTPGELWEDASVGWYTTVVKLHLEASGLLTRDGSPQVLRLTDDGRAALDAGLP